MALFSVIKLSWLLYSLTLLKDNYHIVVPFCIIVYDCFGGHQTPPMVSLRNSSSICHPILHASSPLWLPIQTSEAANRLYIIFIDFCPNLLKFTKKMAEVLRSLAYMLSFLVFYKSMWFTKKKWFTSTSCESTPIEWIKQSVWKIIISVKSKRKH